MATAFITGASQRIGATIAKRLAKDGYNVAINHFASDSDKANAEKVAEESAEAPEEKEVISSESSSGVEEEKKVYITDGKQSLGEVLMAHETSWEEFVRLNNLDQVALQEDQILYFTK